MKHLRLFLLLGIAFLSFPAAAVHLVGGEFQMRYLQNFTYEIQLNVYGDGATLGPGNSDQQVTIGIFSKRTNLLIETVNISNNNSFFVPYKNLQCQASSIQTKVLQYTTQKYLSPGLYNDPDGYYLAWDRCCRNNNIVNVWRPGDMGFVFYAEFPAVGLNGSAFINSMPVLPPMPPDILCAGELYEYSMAATDADGDQLVYSLSEPLRGASDMDDPNPLIQSGPYKTLVWQPGYSLNNMIQGNPPLSINQTTGLISVRPQISGLFVFSVTVEEFRNGVKIGEVRRDIQVKVNPCQSNQKPNISLRIPGATQDYVEGDTLFVTDATDYCYPFSFSDLNVGQTVSISVVPVNFFERPSVSPASGTMNYAGQVINGEICWADCNVNSPNQLYKVLLIAKDNACGNATSDTLELSFLVVPKPNAFPEIVAENLVNNTAEAEVGKPLNFNLRSSDADLDNITVLMQGIGFNPAALGMQLSPLTGTGDLQSAFSWTPTCEQLLNRSEYDLRFIAKDNSCFPNHTDTVLVKIRLVEIPDQEEFLPPNIFTPNNDGFNDTFVMPTLPKDNCEDVFQEIRIYSRWGHLVYDSSNRQFAWDGKDVSDGVYFYRVKFQKRTYKGHVTIVR